MSSERKAKNMISIDWKPDRNSSVSLYQQIVTYFSQRVLHGDWLSGQEVPSQRKLSALFNVNRSTIVEAMDELSAMGLIESRFGGGTRIAGNSWDSLIQSRAPDWQNYIQAGRFRSNLPAVQIINRLEFEPNIIRMSTGELSPDLVQSTLTQRVLGNLSKENLFLNYPDPLGIPSLRTAIQEHLKKKGINVPTSCILIVSGALQALQLVSSGIVFSKSVVYVEECSYLQSLNIFQSTGARLENVRADEKGIVPWSIRPPKDSGHHSMLYTIPTFQNPTGCLMPEDRRKEVLKYCAEHHMPIIEDDVFCDLWLDEPPPPPLKVMDDGGGVVYIGSVSKCFSPGLRLGWLVGPESVVNRLADIKMQMDYGVSVLTQQVVADLFSSGMYDEGIATVREKLRERRAWMLSLLEAHMSDLADWSRPKGGFHIWICLKNQVSSERVFELALKKKLLVPPGSMFGQKGESYIRLTFGYMSKKEMEQSIPILAEIIRSLGGSQ